MTVTLGEFRELASETLGVRLDATSPHARLLGRDSRNLHIIAGPGTGKTTALALLVLKAIFVDDHPSESVVATTFTRKAAAELRSRITAGVVGLADATGQSVDEPSLDVSVIRIGTIDDLCNQALVEMQLGVLTDQLLQNGRMRDAVFAGTAGYRRGGRERLDTEAGLTALFGRTAGVTDIRNALVTLGDRLGHDRVDGRRWAGRSRRKRRLLRIIEGYRESLAAGEQMDFVQLEERFLAELEAGNLRSWLEPTRILVVDEYQDTNLLQEAIYRLVARHAARQGGWFALVGDDDQSIFRFRGATVELFVGARGRYRLRLQSVPLNVNRRSSRPIVRFAERFISLDQAYQAARADGKEILVEAPDRSRWAASDGVPVIGLFREDAEQLAKALADAIRRLLAGGWPAAGGLSVTQPGDIAVIAPTTQAVSESWGNTNIRLFGHLKDELDGRNIKWFNPRGTRLADVPPVAQLLGLCLLCLDGDDSRQPNFVYATAQIHLQEWRDAGVELINADPPPRRPHRLRDFVQAWQAQRPQDGAGEWPRRFPVMELLHELTVWVPALRHSPGFLYLEAITRTLDQLGTLRGPWATLVRRDRWDASVRMLYREFFIPIAMNEVDLDEEVLESLPADAVNALTVHQAKGLEFPVCFVDVGSRFRIEHRQQRRMRYPGDDVMAPYSLEDSLRPFSDGLPAPTRSRRDRAFDDLIRQYYVAFTRAQHVLVLCGLGDEQDGPNHVRNVGTGWTREDEQAWQALEVRSS
jgi:DNA helicase-2/ATP-dependent DNA helicase PcrA